jgi:hypothetical protein
MFENCTTWWLGMSYVIFLYYFSAGITLHRVKLYLYLTVVMYATNRLIFSKIYFIVTSLHNEFQFSLAFHQYYIDTPITIFLAKLAFPDCYSGSV